jgi:hypothetical protein
VIIIVNQSDLRQKVEMFFSFSLGNLDLKVKIVQNNLIWFVFPCGGHPVVNKEVAIGNMNDTTQMSSMVFLPL